MFKIHTLKTYAHYNQSIIIVYAFKDTNVIVCYVWLIVSHLICDIIVCYFWLITSHLKCDVIVIDCISSEM